MVFKVLHAELADTSDWRRRFEYEARSASRLNHPNILTVHDIGEERGTLFLVAELVDGDAEVCCLTLHPDGQRFGLSRGTTRRDIWMFEGFAAPKRSFLRLLGGG